MPYPTKERTMLDRPCFVSFESSLRRAAFVLACSVAPCAAGCTSDSDPGNATPEGGSCPAGGGALAGMATTDCVAPYQEVGECKQEPEDAGDNSDAGVEML